jgi:hypothetical protein
VVRCPTGFRQPFGDEWLRFNGIGENVTWGMYNNERPAEEQKEELFRTLRWAVAAGMTATFHWHNDASLHHLLDVRLGCSDPDRRGAPGDRARGRPAS